MFDSSQIDSPHIVHWTWRTHSRLPTPTRVRFPQSPIFFCRAPDCQGMDFYCAITRVQAKWSDPWAPRKNLSYRDSSLYVRTTRSLSLIAQVMRSSQRHRVLHSPRHTCQHLSSFKVSKELISRAFEGTGLPPTPVDHVVQSHLLWAFSVSC